MRTFSPTLFHNCSQQHCDINQTAPCFTVFHYYFWHDFGYTCCSVLRKAVVAAPIPITATTLKETKNTDLKIPKLNPANG